MADARLSDVTVGDIVNYTLVEGRSKGEARPAVVVRVGSHGRLGLHVFAAGIYDSGSELDRAGSGFQGFIEAGKGDAKTPGSWWPRET